MKVNMKMTWEGYQRKDRRQLFKECIRRGIKIPSNDTPREELILAIHAFDAYHNGVSEGLKRLKNKNSCKSRDNCVLTDFNTEEHYLSLTTDQKRLIEWLIEHSIDFTNGNLHSVNSIEYEEI